MERMLVYVVGSGGQQTGILVARRVSNSRFRRWIGLVHSILREMDAETVAMVTPASSVEFSDWGSLLLVQY